MNKRGFTLLELMIVVAILGVLATIAFPRFSVAVRSANEKTTLGRLSSVRKALVLYSIDLDGRFPDDISLLTSPGNKYISSIFPIFTQEHGQVSSVNYSATLDKTLDSGGWGYVTSGDEKGSLWIQCTHRDANGKVWAEY